MRILLIGDDDTQSLELPLDGGGVSARWNAKLTPSLLAGCRCCVFDRNHGFDPASRDPDLREQLDVADGAAVIIPYSERPWLDILCELPVRLQSLVPDLSSAGAVVIPSDRLSAALPFQDDADPVQDVLIRIVGNAPDFRIRYSASTLTAGDSTPSLPELEPGMRPGATPGMQQHVSRFTPEEVAPVESAADAVAVIAGLYLMHDCLERSHSLSQDVQGQGKHAAGDYWHAIMHRREPDYGNSRYWYRRVGRHPVFADLAQCAAEQFTLIGSAEARDWSERLCRDGAWDPIAWVDFCEQAAGQKQTAFHDAARRVQWIEMLLLLRQTTRDAFAFD